MTELSAGKLFSVPDYKRCFHPKSVYILHKYFVLPLLLFKEKKMFNVYMSQDLKFSIQRQQPEYFALRKDDYGPHKHLA